MGVFNRFLGLAETYLRDIGNHSPRLSADPDLAAAYAELDAALAARHRNTSVPQPAARPAGLPPETLRPDFAVLGVEFGAKEEVCKAAYRAKVKQYHPDTYNAPSEQKRTPAEQAAIENASTEWTRKTKESWTRIRDWYSKKSP